MEIKLDILKLLDRDDIQISILQNIPLHVLFEAMKNGIVIYKKEKYSKENYLEWLLPRYYDHIICYERYLDMALKGE